MYREQEAETGPFGVYAGNWAALTVFWATWRQWLKVVIDGQAVRVGMDWQQVESVIRLSRIPRTAHRTILEKLQAAEDEALEYLHEDR